MNPGRPFSETQLARACDVCRSDPRIAALYAVELGDDSGYHLAVLFSQAPSWSERLDLEMAVARALDLDAAELIDLRRMSLVVCYDVVMRGSLLYVGQPDRLAIFIEQTVARYSAFYPLLEALYWRVETGPLSQDVLE